MALPFYYIYYGLWRYLMAQNECLQLSSASTNSAKAVQHYSKKSFSLSDLIQTTLSLLLYPISVITSKEIQAGFLKKTRKRRM
jgi:hypothetical protein